MKFTMISGVIIAFTFTTILYIGQSRIHEANGLQVDWEAGAVLEDSEAVHSIAWSPDGREVVTVGDDGNGRIWSLDTEEVVTLLEGHSGLVYAVAWSFDGSQIATGGNDNTVRIWDAATGVNLHTLYGHEASLSPGEGNPGGIISVAWSPNGNYLASGGFDGTIRIWQVDIPKESNPLKTFTHGGFAPSIAWNPEGTLIASASTDGVQITDVETGEKLLDFECMLCSSVSWNSDGSKIAIDGNYGESGGAILVFDAETGDLLVKHLIGGDSTHDIIWNPSGEKIAGISGSDDAIFIIDADTGETLSIIEQSNLLAIAWSPDGEMIVAGGADGLVHIWQKLEAASYF